MTKRYYFEEIANCEMCGDDTSDHKIIGQRINKSQGLSPKRKGGISVSVKKCRKCGLLYSSPQPVPFDIQDHYGIPPDSYWKPNYFETEETYFSNQITVAKNLLQDKKNAIALDVGAGIGKCMIALEKAGFEAYGLEPSNPFYEKAIMQMKISSRKLKLGSIEEVEYEKTFFDFITFGAVFEHLYHPAINLKKALGWLKPNGIIHIEVPSSKWLIAKMINLYYKLIGTNYVTNLSPMHVPFHLYEFDLRSFQALGKQLGFSVVEYKYDVCEIYFIPKFLHAVFREFMKWTNTGMQLTVYLRKNDFSRN
jgi:ubiquinone/menaquinone biosynthesis C-methylase UbiE